MPPLLRIPLDDRDGLNYTIIMDNAPGPDRTLQSLQITVQPNPENFMLITTNIAHLINGSIKISVHIIVIRRLIVSNQVCMGVCEPICMFIVRMYLHCMQGDNLYSVSANEIHVTIEGVPCIITIVDINHGRVSTYHSTHCM